MKWNWVLMMKINAEIFIWKKKESIEYVKKHLLPFAQGVEEARYYVEESLKNDREKSNVGNELDPTLEQDILDCQDHEEIIHPDFVQVNPDDIDLQENTNQSKRTFRSIEMKTLDEILEEARYLDKYQKKVLHSALKYA